jgi:mono/diheme cytochrome c family protein
MTASHAFASDELGFSRNGGFAESSGEALFQHICQGCHMENGQGAIGAGEYPALAKNMSLISAPYIINAVSNGQGGMPAFKGMLTDEQIAAVVNYARTHFGNSFPGAAVTVADVKVYTAQ